MHERLTNLLIKGPYWIGAAADLLWAIALLFPSVFGALTGQDGFAPDLRTRLVMGIGATLMLGWTALLVWGVQAPIERRFVILLTAFPVVFGLGIIALVSYVSFDGAGAWVIVKTAFLFSIMVGSYLLAKRHSAG